MVDRLDQLNRSITAMGMETSIELPNLYQRLEDIEAESKTMEANLSQLLNSTLGEQSAQLGARLKDFQAELESIEARVDEQGSQFGSKQANLGQRLEDLEDGLKPLEASFAQINSTIGKQSAQLANITRRVSGVEGRLGSLEANASKQSIAQMEHREKQVGRILKQWSQFKRLLYEKKDGPAPFGQVGSAAPCAIRCGLMG
jgi:chromosome segregation ATPase